MYLETSHLIVMKTEFTHETICQEPFPNTKSCRRGQKIYLLYLLYNFSASTVSSELDFSKCLLLVHPTGKEKLNAKAITPNKNPLPAQMSLLLYNT